MSFLIGRKLGMTQLFDENNTVLPLTVLEAGPCPIVQVKTQEKDGYEAVQLGFKPQKQQRVTSALLGHYKKAKVAPQAYLKEAPKLGKDWKVGDTLNVDVFEVGQKVDLISHSKGRGFQGVVKRWNFSGGPASHGSMSHRRGGSYGQCQFPGEIDKGKKMPGHMGNSQGTAQSLRIIKILKEANIILVKGSVRGPRGGIVYIQNAKKALAPTSQ